jgi:hypothetical protein
MGRLRNNCHPCLRTTGAIALTAGLLVGLVPSRSEASQRAVAVSKTTTRVKKKPPATSSSQQRTDPARSTSAQKPLPPFFLPSALPSGFKLDTYAEDTSGESRYIGQAYRWVGTDGLPVLRGAQQRPTRSIIITNDVSEGARTIAPRPTDTVVTAGPHRVFGRILQSPDGPSGRFQFQSGRFIVEIEMASPDLTIEQVADVAASIQLGGTDDGSFTLAAPPAGVEPRLAGSLPALTAGTAWSYKLTNAAREELVVSAQFRNGAMFDALGAQIDQFLTIGDRGAIRLGDTITWEPEPGLIVQVSGSANDDTKKQIVASLQRSDAKTWVAAKQRLPGMP